MKKLVTILMIIVFLISAISLSDAANRMYWATSLTGGGSGALDAIDGANLVDLDAAIVVLLTGSYLYSLDADSAAAESSPETISPDTNAGDKRWILVSTTVNIGSDAGDDFIVDTNQLVVSGDANAVGMGTAAPAENLHVYENVATSVEIELENSEGAVSIAADGGVLQFRDAGTLIGTMLDSTTTRDFTLGYHELVRGVIILYGHAFSFLITINFTISHIDAMLLQLQFITSSRNLRDFCYEVLFNMNNAIQYSLSLYFFRAFARGRIN